MSWWTNPNLQPKTKSKFVVVFGGSFYLPNIKSLNKPKVEFDTKEYRLLNHKFNYPGNATWQPITIKFVDMNGMGMQTEHFDTGAFLWQIMNNTGYTYPHVNNSQFRDPHFRNVNPKTGQEFGGGHHIATKISFRDDPGTVDIKEFDTWKTITTPEKSSTIANSFGLGLSGVADFENAATSKQKITIYQVSPDKKITECWHLINPIVKTIGWGDLDYSADELVEYELGVVYDWAVMDRTVIGKPLNVDELSYKEFMKTLFVDNPEAFTQEKLFAAEFDQASKEPLDWKNGVVDLNRDGEISDLERKLQNDPSVRNRAIQTVVENKREGIMQMGEADLRRLSKEGPEAIKNMPGIDVGNLLESNNELPTKPVEQVDQRAEDLRQGLSSFDEAARIRQDRYELRKAGVNTTDEREIIEGRKYARVNDSTTDAGGDYIREMPLVSEDDAPNPFSRTTPLGEE